MVYTFNTRFTDDDSFRLGFQDDLAADLSSSLAIQIYVPDNPYSGDYEVTPSEETQVLRTEGFVMANDLVIDPIPSNYGRLIWNGHTLTVY